jgi:hypothetical protein
MTTKCEKHEYPSRDAATSAIAGMNKAKKHKKAPHKAYRCKLCNMWHITSHSKKKNGKRPELINVAPELEIKESLKGQIQNFIKRIK